MRWPMMSRRRRMRTRRRAVWTPDDLALWRSGWMTRGWRRSTPRRRKCRTTAPAAADPAEAARWRRSGCLGLQDRGGRRRAPARAGMLAIAATAATMASTAAASHQMGGTVSTPPPSAARNRPRPSGMPSRVPGTAGSTSAHATPALTCRGDAPSARVSAAERRESTTVAMAAQTALRTARATSTIMITTSIWVSRVATGSPTWPPEARPRSWSTVARKVSTATIPVEVTAMLAAPSAARRSLRAVIRTPSSSGCHVLVPSMLCAIALSGPPFADRNWLTTGPITVGGVLRCSPRSTVTPSRSQARPPL